MSAHPRRWWQAAAGLALLNLVVALCLLLPAREERAAHRDELLDLQRRERSARDAQSAPRAPDAGEQVEAFARGFPSRRDAIDLKAQVTRLARTLSLEVPAVTYTPGELKEAGLVKVTVSLGVAGAYPAIRRYLYELEGLRRHLVIERVGLRDPRGSAELQLQLQLALYLRADEP
jgi:hypothetical protein